MAREPRWPDRDTMLEKVRNGILDDTMAVVDIYDLEDWEVFGEPGPAERRSPPTSPEQLPRQSA